MKTTLKLITWILILSLVLALASCGQSKPSEQPGKETKGTETVAPATSETPTTEPAMTEPTETDFQTPDEQKMPSQRYIGTWYTNDTGNLPLCANEKSLKITEITDEYINFDASWMEGETPVGFFGFAVPQNGEFVFNKEISDGFGFNVEDFNGTLLFDDYSVTISFGDKAPTETLTDNSITFTIKNQADFLNWPADNLPSRVIDQINASIKELEEKGWTDCEVLDHEPETASFCGLLIVPPYDNPENNDLYSVVARHNKTYVVLTLEYNSTTDVCSRARIYYATLFGLDLRDEHLNHVIEKNYPDEVGKIFIIPADYDGFVSLENSY